MNARVDLRRGFHNLFDAGMRAAHYDHHAFGRVDGKRQLAKFERSRLVRDQGDEMDAFRLRVLREGVAVVASVEQDALAAVLDQRGIAPVLLHAGRLAESVIKDGDLRLRRVGARRLRWRARGGAPGEHHGQGCNKVIYARLWFHFSSPLLTCLVDTGLSPDPATAFVKDSALRVVRCPTSWSTAGRCWQVRST